jgi:hypothetical protein
VNLGETEIVIGGIVGTAAEHAELLKAEGQSDRCIDYFIGNALERALEGWRPGPAAVPMSAYKHRASVKT